MTSYGHRGIPAGTLPDGSLHLPLPSTWAEGSSLQSFPQTLSFKRHCLVSGPAPTVGRKGPISLIVADRQISGFSGYSLGILGSVSGNKDLIEDTILDTHPIIFSIVVHARAGKDTQQLSRMDTQRI